jgi:TPP-dependent pyruvate/acetoin dehydrogenase alpha subunit
MWTQDSITDVTLRTQVPLPPGASGTSPAGEIGTDRLLELYRTMVRIRRFEEAVADLVASQEVRCPCHLYIGQEAIAAGVCAALQKDDTVWGGHRSHGHYLAKGGDLAAMMAEIFGRATGCAAGRGGSMHLLAKDVGVLGTVPIVAATIPLAVGAGLAAKLRSDGRVSVAFLGDGATEEGHFFESVNLAALYKLAVIFVIENNLYASHMHLAERRPSDNLDRIGDLFAMPSYRLDGNDVGEVYRATATAVQRGRNGQGPTLLECRTYRWRGHVGHRWDEDVGVKRKNEIHEWMPKCPITRARKDLLAAGLLEGDLSAIDLQAAREVESAIAAARLAPRPGRDTLLDHVFA